MASRSAIHFADCLRHQSTTLCVSAATTLNIHHCQSVIARNGRSRSLGCQRILPPDLCVEVNRGSRAGSRPEHADGHDVNRAMRPYPLTTVGSRVLLQAVVPLTYAPIIPLNKQINQIVPSSASAFAPRQCSLLPPPPPPPISAHHGLDQTVFSAALLHPRLSPFNLQLCTTATSRNSLPPPGSAVSSSSSQVTRW